MGDVDGSYHRPEFFEQGVRFECQRCLSCCSGEPGRVVVSDEEASAIRNFLEEKAPRLLPGALVPFGEGFEIPENKDGTCRFLDKNCLIYPVRPLQCKAFPFWFDLMRSEKKWKQAVRSCPGIGKGRLYTKAEILDLLHRTMDLSGSGKERE